MGNASGSGPRSGEEGAGSRRDGPHEEFEDLYVESTPSTSPAQLVPAATDRSAPGRAGLTDRESALQRRARKRVLKRRAFRASLVSYLSVSLMLVVIWAVTMFGGFFWPIFPIMGMGLGVVGQGWDAFRRDDDDEIEREMERLRRKGLS
jgi:hypothetical protein